MSTVSSLVPGKDESRHLRLGAFIPRLNTKNMRVPVERKIVCSDCEYVFFLNSAERNSRCRAHCPACGSVRWQARRARNKADTARLAGINKAGSAVVGRGSIGCERRLVRAAKTQKALSSPTNYRLATLRNRHARMKASNAAAARKTFCDFWAPGGSDVSDTQPT
jgi:hypothetical protein